MMWSWCLAVLLALFLLAPLPAFAGDIIGAIIAKDSKATLRNDKAQELDARVGMQVEERPIGPPMACQGGNGFHRQPIVKVFAGPRKQVVKNPAHGQHRGARIDQVFTRANLMHFAPRCRGSLKDSDAHALRRKVYCRGKPSGTGTNHNDVVIAHPARALLG